MKIVLGINETITILVKENGSTGYIWDFNKSQNVVKLEKSILQNKNSEHFTCGETSIIQLTITGLNQGKIIFCNMQPWNQNIGEFFKVEVV
ncbi:MAG: chagasin family peptidase inhibitor [Caudoviricetes sp.]|nr:MAG: chagasin family peptidase inhibitor [Caudoviricetes sp.]